MKNKIILLSVWSLLLMLAADAQELKAKVTVVAGRVPTTVDRKIFTTLQNALSDLMNKKKWGPDHFSNTEKIECNFLLNISEVPETNVYKASLSVQAARPVYNSTYQSPLVNYMDNNITFRYQEYQPIEFNENRVSGTDPLASNITAVFAFYAYLIIGLDYDSFSPHGGEPYFQKMQLLVNNAPEARLIDGWRGFDGTRNRYWLMDNLTNSRYNLIHDVYYYYYRNVMDQLYDNEIDARSKAFEVLNFLLNLNRENPNTMIQQFFFFGRADEWIGIFSKASTQDKQRALEVLQKLDIPNSAKYKTGLK
jgi:hypothetical protein